MLNKKQLSMTQAKVAGPALVVLGLLFLWPFILKNNLSSGEFLPHIICYLKKPGLIWLHFISDLLIGLAYVAISSTLAYIVYKCRHQIPFCRMFLAFGLFIVACGMTHFMEVLTLWKPYYWLSGWIKFITAVASVVTAVVLPPLVPGIFTLIQANKLSIERKIKLEIANKQLEKEVLGRKNIEEEQTKTLSLLNAALESTADGILVVDRKGHITTCNQKVAEMWKIPFSIVESRDEDEVLVHQLNQLNDPEVFLKKVKELNAHMDRESYDLLEFKDGRIFERYSQPQQIGGTNVGRVWSFRDISKQKQAEERLSYLARFDALTDLPNRTFFSDRLSQALIRAPWHKRSVAVLFLDLDGFKNINDTLGHTFGDLLLKAVAKRLTNCIREGDTVARLGGDEFVMMLDDLAQPGDILLVTQKILKTFSSPFNLEGHELFITSSIGIAVYPNDGKDNETLLRNADAAMYCAKKQGKNSYQLFSHPLNAKRSDT